MVVTVILLSHIYQPTLALCLLQKFEEIYILQHCNQIHHHVAIIAITLAESSYPEFSFLITKATEIKWPMS